MIKVSLDLLAKWALYSTALKEFKARHHLFQCEVDYAREGESYKGPGVHVHFLSTSANVAVVVLPNEEVFMFPIQTVTMLNKLQEHQVPAYVQDAIDYNDMCESQG